MAMDINKYQKGTNDRLDAILEEGMQVWIINGPKGRKPILADSEEEAKAKYLNK